MKAIIFDFDGVLLESELASAHAIAAALTEGGHPTTPEQSMASFMGLSGRHFAAAIERHCGGPPPAGFGPALDAADARHLADGLPEVAGAVAFVRSLPPGLPLAVASSSSTAWLRAHLGHLGHLGLAERFGEHLYSGREHVSRGKPAPDLYLHAAAALAVPIADCVIIEDSPVGVTGALASGARVIGLAAGGHCAPDHGDRLRALGVREVARSFAEVATFLGLPATD